MFQTLPADCYTSNMNIIRLDQLDNKELNIYHSLKEPELYHYFEPEPGLFIAESPNVILRAIAAGYQPISLLFNESSLKTDGELLSEHVDAGLPAYILPDHIASEITGFNMVRGLLAAMRRRPLPDLDDILDHSERVVILEDVVNPTNLGSIMRSAAALNMDAVILTKDSTDPLYRRAARVSMGTVFQIPWTIMSKEESDNYLHILKDHDYKTVAMALVPSSIDISDQRLKSEKKLAVIMGTEGPGLKASTIDNSDYHVMIPMSHGVDSLNVAAASALAFWELTKKDSNQ